MAAQKSRWTNKDRFKKEYGLPSGRPDLATKDLADKYIFIKKLNKDGAGALNEGINLVEDTKTGKHVVQKMLDPNNRVLLRELILLQVLDHPNIIKYVDGFLDTSSWYRHEASIYIEYCNLGNAQHLLNKYHHRNIGKADDDKDYIPEVFIWHMFRSLASALQYLHFGIKPDDNRSPAELDTLVKQEDYNPGVHPMIIHRDIKPENIFFRKVQPGWNPVIDRRKLFGVIPVSKKTYNIVPQYPRIVLGDFVSPPYVKSEPPLTYNAFQGLALQYNDEDWNEDKAEVGTYQWMPPELPKFYCRGDVWAVGAVILALCRQMPDGVVKPAPVDWTEGKVAWPKHRDARKGIRDHGVGKRYSPELNHVVHECLRFNRLNRPLAFKLLAMIDEGEEAAGRKGFLENDTFPKWVWGGAEDRVHRTKAQKAKAAEERAERTREPRN
ncbi:MAG: hypothetical protein Q9218_007040 [Villophora microphyllina]